MKKIYSDAQYVDEDITCPECGEILEFEYENTGYSMPNGQEHWEVTREYCKECGYTN